MMARILLADDEADMLEPVSYALSQHGFEVTCVEDGDAALERARSGEFDLLLCDVMMPGTLGTDVCRILRAEGDLPIILLTARCRDRPRARPRARRRRLRDEAVLDLRARQPRAGAAPPARARPDERAAVTKTPAASDRLLAPRRRGRRRR